MVHQCACAMYGCMNDLLRSRMPDARSAGYYRRPFEDSGSSAEGGDFADSTTDAGPATNDGITQDDRVDRCLDHLANIGSEAYSKEKKWRSHQSNAGRMPVDRTRWWLFPLACPWTSTGQCSAGATPICSPPKLWRTHDMSVAPNPTASLCRIDDDHDTAYR